jgi:hypothetical protein
MLNLRRVRVFSEVVERRSVSAEAVPLDYTQPSVSHHVSALEGELDQRASASAHLGCRLRARRRCIRHGAATSSRRARWLLLVNGDHLGAELRDSLTPVARVSEEIHQRTRPAPTPP